MTQRKPAIVRRERPAAELAAITANMTTAQHLDHLASRLNRCTYNWTDPERYLVERNAIVGEMRALAKRLGPVPERRPTIAEHRAGMARDLAPRGR